MTVDLISRGMWINFWDTIPIIPHRYWRINITDNTAAGANTIACLLEVQLHAGLTGFGPDVLEGGTPLGDSFYSGGFTSAGACDGNLVDDIGGHIWGSANTAFPHWWKYDLGVGRSADVNGISIVGRGTGNEGTNVKDFQVQYSDNDSTWTTKWSVTGATFTAYQFRHFPRTGAPSYTGSPHGAHAHWRIKMLFDNGGNICSAEEIEMRATPGGADLCNGGAGISDGAWTGHVIANAFDNNTGTFYGSSFTVGGSDVAYGGYSFPAPVSVAQIAWRNTVDTGQTPKTLYIQYADSASGPWTTAWGAGVSTGWTANETRLFTDPNYV